ncbi:phage portal protein [Dysgonomonas sp. Marseille-P4677]|uniref:phage portal protein n=1 Tax=Dysgonomonas sp. Marseille-P4677 TaxID=2364790 RepID=UPI0019137812|nr:phage portal protein [Dysgonomonas sp. Marseille-P4677]MBK5722569.1 phage portal protein [Dysgonomonas sp. Marseille-P4677]
MEELKPIRQTETELDFNTDDVSKLIETLKSGRLTDLPNVDELKQSYYVENHDVFNRSKRPDKPRKKKNKRDQPREQINPVTGQKETVNVPVEEIVDDGVTLVNRLGFSEQKKIVNQAVAFSAGNPVELTANPNGEQEKKLYDLLVDTFEDNKIDSFNRKICRSIFAFKEAAECWYHVPNGEGGWKLRVMRFAPELGDKLYPYFDGYNDMVAFSREFTAKDKDKKDVTYLTTYTSDYIHYFKQDGSKWDKIGYDAVAVGKIQVVYGFQEKAEYEDVNPLIARREKLRSNFGDTTDYHASPKVIADGSVTDFTEKEEAGGIIRTQNGAKVSLLTWDQAPEAIKLEDELLLEDTNRLTDTADLSFNNLKSLGSGISGETLRRLLTAPILKVYEKKEFLDEYMQRRVNLVKAYLGVIYPELKEASKTLRIKAEIKPLQLEDYDEYIDRLKKENGGKPIKSQAQTIRDYIMSKGGSEEDVQKVLGELKEESASNFIEETYQV